VKANSGSIGLRAIKDDKQWSHRFSVRPFEFHTTDATGQAGDLDDRAARFATGDSMQPKHRRYSRMKANVYCLPTFFGNEIAAFSVFITFLGSKELTPRHKTHIKYKTARGRRRGIAPQGGQLPDPGQ